MATGGLLCVLLLTTPLWFQISFTHGPIENTSPSIAPPAPTTTPDPPGLRFPSRTSAGLPADWIPRNEVIGEFRVSDPGRVVEDLRIRDGVIIIDAPNVTLRRVQAINTNLITDSDGTCKNGLLIEDSEFLAERRTTDDDLPVIAPGGYTLRNSVIDGVPEGLRVGGLSRGCDGVVVESSFIRIVAPVQCEDWHGDGIQGYDGNSLTVRNSAIIFLGRDSCGGTAPFFYPSDQGNTSVDVDGLLVSGGGYSFRNGTRGSVRNLYVIDKSWYYAPISVACGLLSSWQANTARWAENDAVIPLNPISCSGTG